MSDVIKVSKWAIGMGLTILLAIGAQTLAWSKWTGQVTERLDAVTTQQQTIKREVMDSLATTESRLNRRIERLEDIDRTRKIN